MVGNCLTYAVGMLLAEGFTGSIKPAVLWHTWPPKLRFYYRGADGQLRYFYPTKPRRGWHACWHALWFEGAVRRA